MILPFEKNVPMTFYQNKAYPLGIIEGNIGDKEKLESWYAQEYINCRFTLSKSNKFDVGTEDFYFYNDGIIKRQYICLYKSSFAMYNAVYSQIMRDFLLKGFYIRGNYNEKYISTSRFYKKRDRMHDYLLVGFDENAKTFKAVGYQSNMEYDYFDISFEAFDLSLEYSTEYYIDFNILEFNREKILTFDIAIVYKKLKYYINSKNDIMRENVAYGINAIEKLQEYFILQHSKGNLLDIRYSRAIMEHKKLMLFRLKLLFDYGYLESDYFAEKYQYVCKCSKILHALSIKYNISLKDKYFEKVIALFKEIVILDMEILSEVVRILETSIIS